MESNLRTISIGGKNYPMCFSVKAAQEVSLRYGGLEHVAAGISEGGTEKILGEVVWLLALMIGQGAARRNLLEGAGEKPATEEEIGILMDVSDLANLQGQLMDAMTAGMTREVEVDPGESEKNAETTQG